MEKLEYFNQMHIRAKFEGANTLDAWCQMLLDHLPQELHERIKSLDQGKMLKIKDLMRVRIHFYKDMANHAYFFTDPQYKSDIAEKLLQKIKQSNRGKAFILRDLASSFS
jgi:shikimate kinase